MFHGSGRAERPSDDRLRELLREHSDNVTAVAQMLRRHRVTVTLQSWPKNAGVEPTSTDGILCQES